MKFLFLISMGFLFSFTQLYANEDNSAITIDGVEAIMTFEKNDYYVGDNMVYTVVIKNNNSYPIIYSVKRNFYEFRYKYYFNTEEKIEMTKIFGSGSSSKQIEQILVLLPNDNFTFIGCINPLLPDECYFKFRYIGYGVDKTELEKDKSKYPKDCVIWSGEFQLKKCFDIKSPSQEIWEDEFNIITNESISFIERKNKLDEMMKNKNYLKTKMLLYFLNKISIDNPIKHNIIEHLTEAALAGYGFESFDKLIDIAENEKENIISRLFVLDVLKTICFEKEIIIWQNVKAGIVITKNQKINAIKALNICAESKNESLAKKAKQLLKDIENAKTSEKKQ